MSKRVLFKEFYPCFLAGNLIFFFFQIEFILFQNSSFLKTVEYPAGINWLPLLMILFQVALYAVLSLWQFFLLWGLDGVFKKSHLNASMLYIFFSTALLIISANTYYFPLSKFSRVISSYTEPRLLVIVLSLNLIFLGGLFFLSSLKFFRKNPLISFIMCLTGTVFFIWQLPGHLKDLSAPVATPNLFIIGIDSLNPAAITVQTPHLAQFIKNSVFFKDTVSPLSRTFPAWTSILTGMYPLHHGARENLYPPDLVKSEASFAWNLRKKGYVTLYASDDRRFNTLDKEYGFQHIIGPLTGIHEVLLGSFYDFPLSNLLINSPLSHWFMPYNYMNRAGFFSYYPATFDKEIQNSLLHDVRTKPFFLAVHYTLPHWPYAFASSSVEFMKNEFSVYNKKSYYFKAVHAVDHQVGELLDFLRKTDALKNSVVILLSDHGEALYLPGSRKTQKSLYQGKGELLKKYLSQYSGMDLDKSAGHGSDLLSPEQLNCVLAFQVFQNGKLATSSFQTPIRVSLLDIAPTVAELFHFNQQTSGISLTKTLFEHMPPPQDRFFMLESGMLPNQFLNKEKVMDTAVQLFRVNPVTYKIEVRRDRIKSLQRKKLYGILQNEWLLALYPSDKKYIHVLLNLKSGQWVDSMDTPFAKNSPALSLLYHLKKFYAYDLASLPNVPRKPDK